MQDRLHKIANNILDKWRNLERQQKMRLILGVVVLVLVIGVTLYFALKPEMSVLYQNKDVTTLSAVELALEEAGIKSEITDNGRSLAVRKKDEFAARAALANNAAITGNDAFGYEDFFSQAGVGTSESVKKQMNRLAQENKIASTLEQMDGIQDAIVSLSLPDNNGLYYTEAEKATASVYITQTGQLDDAKAQAIADAVAAGVTGLERENVKIINQYMETVYSGDKQGTSSLSSDYEIELKRKNEIESKIITSLNPLFDDIKITANIKVNTNQKESQSTTFYPASDDNNTGIINHQQSSSQTATTTGSGTEVGLGANDAATTNYATGNSTATDTGTSKDSSIDYSVSSNTQVVKEGYGDLINAESSVSVIVYKYRTYDQTYMEENGLLGSQNWVDFKEQQSALMPVKLTIDEAITENLINGTGIDKFSLVGYELYNFVDAEIVPIDWQQIVIFVILALLILMLAFGLIRRTQSDEIITLDPELSVEDLLVSTQLEEEKKAEVNRLKDIDYTTESEVKRQIDKFVEEKPEAVAQLLRNWLTESWE